MVRIGSAILCVALMLATGASPAGSAVAAETAAHMDRAARIARGIPELAQGERSLQLTLQEWMAALAVPGVSLVVIDDYRIDLARGFGVTAKGSAAAPIAPDTLFQAASIAKPVTALAVLRQVERGRFDLDQDVNGYLSSWKLPEGQDQGSEAVTIRRLLAHTAGVTPGGFAGYARGEPLPSIVQVLDGSAPATNGPAQVATRPGTEVAYSGLGYSILQLALEDSLQNDFQTIVRQAVISPLDLRNTSFEQEFAQEHRARVALGHFGTGAPVDGGWRVFPELAAAGLWTTASDLATIVIDVADSKRGADGVVLSRQMAQTMLTIERDEMGLGFVVRNGDRGGFFAHSGGNAGYFAHFRMLADSGKGIVIMTNSESGQLLAPLVIASVASEYAWPEAERRGVSEALAQRLFEHVDLIAKGGGRERTSIDVNPEVIARYVGEYELSPGLLFDITVDDGRLMLRLGDQPRFPLFAESTTRFFLKAVDAQITFVVDADGNPQALVLHQGGRDQRAPKVFGGDAGD